MPEFIKAPEARYGLYTRDRPPTFTLHVPYLEYILWMFLDMPGLSSHAWNANSLSPYI